jgi:hypothetical protein
LLKVHDPRVVSQAIDRETAVFRLTDKTTFSSQDRSRVGGLSRRLVAEEALTCFPAEVARVAHLLQERTRAVLRVVETGVEGLHDVEDDVEADEVGER